MNRSDRRFYMALAAIAVILIGGYAGLVAYTGFSSPFSIVTSQSMQHNQTQSELGCIDTGDMVIVQDPSKTKIHSYIEGTQDGYSSFGDYGSVIIYERGENKNPVIHRAILWLDYNSETGTWSAPQLQDYKGEWKSDNGNNWYDLKGTLTLKEITISKKTVKIDLDSITNKKSGYLTMGDNAVSNTYFDQTVGIIDHPIGIEDIRSVAIFEIPWIGCIKLFINGSSNLKYVENSIPSLIMSFISIFMLLLIFDAVSLYKNQKNAPKRMENMERCER